MKSIIIAAALATSLVLPAQANENSRAAQLQILNETADFSSVEGIAAISQRLQELYPEARF
ncbi:hypothetical protein OAL13_00145 [bacterium]|nr:hypothetical protein [bacterium]